MFELKCPYCESEQEPLYDNAESGVWFNHKCTNCSKVFIYQIEYWPTLAAKSQRAGIDPVKILNSSVLTKDQKMKIIREILEG